MTHILKVRAPEGYYEGGESDDFSEYALEDIQKTGADVAAYWYREGSYEGSGEILLLLKGEFLLFSASHCSCYGPTDDLPDSPISRAATLDELVSRMTEDARAEAEPLIVGMREYLARVAHLAKAFRAN